MRLACLYALLDKSALVREMHLLAAVALWEYCLASARFIFGDTLGDPTADTIVQSLRDAPDGLDRTTISALFRRHKSGAEISRALTVLREHGLATVSSASRDVNGRPREIWFAVGNTAKKAK
jgi:DNA-binding transcriptional ArsR family regulator